VPEVEDQSSGRSSGRRNLPHAPVDLFYRRRQGAGVEIALQARPASDQAGGRVEIKAGRELIVDDVQMVQDYPDSPFLHVMGDYQGASWAGTAHASDSTCVAADYQWPMAEEFMGRWTAAGSKASSPSDSSSVSRIRCENVTTLALTFGWPIIST